MKRILDILISIIALVLLSPVMLIVSILILFHFGSPVFFTQVRPGKNKKLFKMIKFRTMSNEKDDNGELLSDTIRLTKYGKFIRSTSLDELPELINIIKGEMSLVGPRPLLPEYLDKYSVEHGKRHDVKPGLTGWAQINGRNSLSWSARFDLDLWYIQNRSLLLDFKILILTVFKVIKRDEVNPESEVTMAKFNGYDDK